MMDKLSTVNQQPTTTDLPSMRQCVAALPSYHYLTPRYRYFEILTYPLKFQTQNSKLLKSAYCLLLILLCYCCTAYCFASTVHFAIIGFVLHCKCENCWSHKKQTGVSTMKSKTKAQCRACQKRVASSGSKKHVLQCKHITSFLQSKVGEQVPGYLMKVCAQYQPDTYWMYITAPADMNLEQLDRFLRKLWLECCNHLSEFQFPSTRATIEQRIMNRMMGIENADDDLEDTFEEEMSDKFDVGSKKKLRLIGDVAKLDDTFNYIYDFGSSTYLKFTPISKVHCPANKFIIVMRNDSPDDPCGLCDSPAVGVCTYCDHALCEQCKTSNHFCKDAHILPILNSPRAGVCGYDGPGVEEDQD